MAVNFIIYVIGWSLLLVFTRELIGNVKLYIALRRLWTIRLNDADPSQRNEVNGMHFEMASVDARNIVFNIMYIVVTSFAIYGLSIALRSNANLLMVTAVGVCAWFAAPRINQIIICGMAITLHRRAWLAQLRNTSDPAQREALAYGHSKIHGDVIGGMLGHLMVVGLIAAIGYTSLLMLERLS